MSEPAFLLLTQQSTVEVANRKNKCLECCAEEDEIRQHQTGPTPIICRFFAWQLNFPPEQISAGKAYLIESHYETKGKQRVGKCVLGGLVDSSDCHCGSDRDDGRST
jgi:hypothetical protein